MTRPMPGPPECECREVPAHLWTTYAGAVDPNTRFEYTPECPLHGEVSSPKRLTDAECAAEYWRALRDDEWEDYDMLDGYGPPNIDPWGKEWWARSGIANEDRLSTWRRFATRPHALEEA